MTNINALIECIETAPKDGSEILSCGGTFYDGSTRPGEKYKTTGWTIISWDTYSNAWIGPYEGPYGTATFYEPTHWMPLPELPEEYQP